MLLQWYELVIVLITCKYRIHIEKDGIVGDEDFQQGKHGNQGVAIGQRLQGRIREGKMKTKLCRVAQRRLQLGRLGFPVGAIALATVVAGTFSAQAVGPVLSGNVQGFGGLVASQALVIKTGSPNNLVDGADQAVVAVNEDGTDFTVAMETFIGRKQTLKLVMVNLSGKDANGIVELNVPAGVAVDVLGADDVLALAQSSRNNYLFKMRANGNAANDNADIKVDLMPKADSAPGFYSITGRIFQVAN